MMMVVMPVAGGARRRRMHRSVGVSRREGGDTAGIAGMTAMGDTTSAGMSGAASAGVTARTATAAGIAGPGKNRTGDENRGNEQSDSPAHHGKSPGESGWAASKMTYTTPSCSQRNLNDA